jgi:hypothetical protein
VPWSRIFFPLLIAQLASASACAAPEMYTAEPIRGRVVDAETREPLAGVIVVAEWQLEGGLMHSDPFEDLEVRETVTGPDGTFHIDGFGPTPIPKGRLEDNDPRLVLYKVGTEFKILSNRLAPPGHSPTRVGRIPGRSVWNGRTIELKRQAPDFGKASRHLMLLRTAFQGKRCGWRKMPRLLAALVTTATMAENGDQGFRASILRTLNSLPKNPECGSVEDAIGEYLQ